MYRVFAMPLIPLTLNEKIDTGSEEKPSSMQLFFKQTPVQLCLCGSHLVASPYVWHFWGQIAASSPSTSVKLRKFRCLTKAMLTPVSAPNLYHWATPRGGRGNLQYWGGDEDVCSVFWVQLLRSPGQVCKSWVELVIKVRWCRQLPQAAGCQVEISLCCDYSWKHEGQQLLLGGRMRSLIQETATIPLFPSAMINQAPQGSPSNFSILVLPLFLLRNLRFKETNSPQVTATDFGVPVRDTAYATVTFQKASPSQMFQLINLLILSGP